MRRFCKIRIWQTEADPKASNASRPEAVVKSINWRDAVNEILYGLTYTEAITDEID
jgi:hypothetical protein